MVPPVADVVDVVARFRVAPARAAAADAYLLDLDLETLHHEHVREADGLRGELHPAAADHLARLATAVVPPSPVEAATCAVTSPDGREGAALTEAQRQALIAQVAATGDRIDPAQVLKITRGWDGRPVWIERGNGNRGLQHLLRPARVLAFLDVGVPPADIPGVALRAVAQRPPIGRPEPRNAAKDAALRRQGKEPALVYAVDIGGRRRTIVVVKRPDGSVVTAYPYSKKVWPL